MSRWIGFSEDDGDTLAEGSDIRRAQPRPLANALRTTRSTFAQLSLKNDAGHGVMFRVAESNKGGSYAPLCGQFLC
jgi:hypothetical protein